MKTGSGGFFRRQESKLRVHTEEELEMTRCMQQFVFDGDGTAGTATICQPGLVQGNKIGGCRFRYHIDAVFEFVGQPIEMIIAP